MLNKASASRTRLPAGALKTLRQLMASQPNVVGFSATLKDELVRGRASGRKVIRIYVERILSRQKKKGARSLPATIGGVPVEVVAIGRPEASAGAAGHIEKKRPLVGGISITAAYQSNSYGTLGYFLRDNPPPPNQKPQWYILSCAHVLNGHTSDVETMQPSAADGGKKPDDYVGTKYDDTYTSVDAAISKIVDTEAKAELVGIDPPIGAKQPELNGPVKKSGRTTGVTEGRIVDVDLVMKVNYKGQGVERTFKDCLMVESAVAGKGFGDHGDSGSVVLDRDDRFAVGMIFAVSGKGGKARTIAHKMINVLEVFPRLMMVAPNTSWP
jgi:hypothetical protein